MGKKHLACFIGYDRVHMKAEFSGFLQWMKNHANSIDEKVETSALFILRCPDTDLLEKYDLKALAPKNNDELYNQILSVHDDRSNPASMSKDEAHLIFYQSNLDHNLTENDKFDKITFLGHASTIDEIGCSGEMPDLVKIMANLINNHLELDGQIRVQVCYATNFMLSNNVSYPLIEHISSKIDPDISISAPSDLSLVCSLDQLGRSIDLPISTDNHDFLKIAKFLKRDKKVQKLQKKGSDFSVELGEFIAKNTNISNLEDITIVQANNRTITLSELIDIRSVIESQTDSDSVVTQETESLKPTNLTCVGSLEISGFVDQ